MNKKLRGMLAELASGSRRLHTATCCELAKIATSSGFYCEREYHSTKCENFVTGKESYFKNQKVKAN